MTTTEPTQLDRIEQKLDQVLAFRDLIFKLALPRVPAALREQAIKAMAALGKGT